MARLNAPLGSAVARSKWVSAERLINCYAQKAPDGAPVQFYAVGAPGLKKFATVPRYPIRNMLRSSNGTLYVVAGTSVYKVDKDGVATEIPGPALPGAGLIYMACSATQIAIVAEPLCYVVDIDGQTIAPVTDPDFPGASSVTYQDGYFLFSKPTSPQFFISELLDATAYNALDFASAEKSPDDATLVFSAYNEVWVFGSDSIEIWWNSGAADFPFERKSSASIERGVMAPSSVAGLDNSVMWVGNDGLVYRAEGYTPSRISTHEVEKLIGECTEKESIVAFTWTQDGHAFYALKIPDKGCQVYDAATQQWHERATYGRDFWRGSCAERAYGKQLVGDDTTGDIWELDFGTMQDGDEPMLRTMVLPTIWAEDRRFITHRVQADFDMGVGLTDGQGSDPQCALQHSDDGGQTWSNELWRSIGKVGEYRNRAIWWRRGSSRQRTYRLVISDPVTVAFPGLTVDIEGARV